MSLKFSHNYSDLILLLNQYFELVLGRAKAEQKFIKISTLSHKEL